MVKYTFIYIVPQLIAIMGSYSFIQKNNSYRIPIKYLDIFKSILTILVDVTQIQCTQYLF